MAEPIEMSSNDPVSVLASTLRRMPNGKEMAANIYRRLFTLREFDPEFHSKAVKIDEPTKSDLVAKIQHMHLDKAN